MPNEPVEIRSTLIQFFQTPLGIMLISSVVIPLFIFLYNVFVTHQDRVRTNEMEKQVITYRLDLILHSLEKSDYVHLHLAYDALQGEHDMYYPLFPEFEKNVPLVGLIYRITPLKDLHTRGAPPIAATLRELTSILLTIVGPTESIDDFYENYKAQSEIISILKQRLQNELSDFKKYLY